MKIRSKLFISAGISIIVAIMLISLVSVTSDRLAESNKEHEIFINVSNGMTELNSVTYDYLLHREKRMEEQWYSKYNSLKEVLDETVREQKVISIRTDYVTVSNLFSQITSNNKEIEKLIQEGASQERIDTSTQLEERLVTQLLVISNSVITDVSRLAEQKHAEADEAQRFTANLILVLITTLAIGIIASSFLVGRSISKPLTRLAEYSKIVGEGKYIKDFEFKGKDEIASVARDVKTMVGQLRKHREHLEELVEERTIKLTAANKELEAFSYSVSHDLRAPLRSIDGFSQALEEDYASKLDKEGKNFINRIRAATKRMSGLIDDMLILSRITRKKLHYKKVDLSKIANEIAEDLKKVQPERRVKFKIVSRLNIVADEGLIRIVLENLLGNAYKFTENNKNANIEFSISSTNGRKTYTISDNGVGFDMTYYDKLFSPFQRLHSEIEFKGTGIGLAIVQRIVHLHHGKVWAESKVGEGATFYFNLKSKKETSSE